MCGRLLKNVLGANSRSVRFLLAVSEAFSLPRASSSTERNPAIWKPSVVYLDSGHRRNSVHATSDPCELQNHFGRIEKTSSFLFSDSADRPQVCHQARLYGKRIFGSADPRPRQLQGHARKKIRKMVGNRPQPQ